MQKPLLIIDPNCPVAYDPYLLEKYTLGGVEATVIRVAEKLGETLPVVVAQHNRRRQTLTKNVTYAPLNSRTYFDKWHGVIVIRNIGFALNILPLLVMKYVPIWVWNHDLQTQLHYIHFKAANALGVGSVYVSDFQRQQILDFCAADQFEPNQKFIKRIYNPLDDGLLPDKTPVDSHKLLFASSAHKGLQETIEVFTALYAKDPRFHLVVTDPGYSTPKRVLFE